MTLGRREISPLFTPTATKRLDGRDHLGQCLRVPQRKDRGSVALRPGSWVWDLHASARPQGSETAWFKVSYAWLGNDLSTLNSSRLPENLHYFSSSLVSFSQRAAMKRCPLKVHWNLTFLLISPWRCFVRNIHHDYSVLTRWKPCQLLTGLLFEAVSESVWFSVDAIPVSNSSRIFLTGTTLWATYVNKFSVSLEEMQR